MRVAWPELVVLIVLGALFVLAVEIGLLCIANHHLTAWLVFPGFVLLAVFDLWAALRTVDWMFAGPARRNKQRIL